MRRIKQIATSESMDDDFARYRTLYALCDDGSLWVHHAEPGGVFDSSQPYWRRVVNVPQDEQC